MFLREDRESQVRLEAAGPEGGGVRDPAGAGASGPGGGLAAHPAGDGGRAGLSV